MPFKKGLFIWFIKPLCGLPIKNNNYPETPYKPTKPQITAVGFCDGMVLCTQLA